MPRLGSFTGHSPIRQWRPTHRPRPYIAFSKCHESRTEEREEPRKRVVVPHACNFMISCAVELAGKEAIAEMNRIPAGLSFVFLCAMSLVLWFRPLLQTFEVATGDDQYTHILLIVPLTVALIIQGWRERAFKPQLWIPAAGLLVISLLIGGLARWGNFGERSGVRLSIEMAGLVVWWIASFVLCFGRPALRFFRFPLFFLFWMVPIPRFLLEMIVASLQRGSAIAAQLMFSICTVPVSREGTILFLPGLELDVNPECSSIRSSLMLIVVTMVLAHLLLRSPCRKALVVAAAVPLSVAKNGLRIFTLAMIATKIDPEVFTGRLHRQGGVIFFLVALAAIMFLVWILRRGEEEVKRTEALHQAGPS